MNESLFAERWLNALQSTSETYSRQYVPPLVAPAQKHADSVLLSALLPAQGTFRVILPLICLSHLSLISLSLSSSPRFSVYFISI